MSETGTRRGQRHTQKAARRNMASAAVRTKARRSRYRGTTRSRDTQVMGGHPLSGLWDQWIDATRSSRPGVRAHARRKLAGVES